MHGVAIGVVDITDQSDSCDMETPGCRWDYASYMLKDENGEES